jgi:AcrR family transcriptional regulator
MKDSSALPLASPSSRLRGRIRQRKQPVQRRSRQTVEVLLEATLQVLKRDGHAALTTTRVAERAGVSVGTLYQYYPDKGSLVTALKVKYFDALVGATRAAGEEVVGAPLEVALRHMLGTLLRVKRDNLELTLALRGPMAELDGAALVREASGQLVAVAVAVLAGAAPRLKDRERRARVLIAALEGAVSSAVFDAPQWLAADWFLEELVALGVGYIRASRG